MDRLVSRGVSNSHGSALLVVLILLGIIAILAAIVARSVSGAALELRASRTSSTLDTDLRAGIDLGAVTILKLGDQMRSADAAIDLADRRITVRVTNERARIDLNRASPEVLMAMLKADGLEDNEAASLAANVVSWRGGAQAQVPAFQQQDQDHGSPPQTFGFDPQTISNLKTARPNNPTLHFFFHPIQLESVPGFSRQRVKRLFPLLSVANGDNTINPFIADPAVLKALPGVSGNQVEAFVDARDANVSRKTAMQLLGVDKSLLSQEAAGGWRLQITTTPRTGRPHDTEAVISDVKSDAKDPYRVLYILDDADR